MFWIIGLACLMCLGAATWLDFMRGGGRGSEFVAARGFDDTGLQQLRADLEQLNPAPSASASPELDRRAAQAYAAIVCRPVDAPHSTAHAPQKNAS